MDLVSICIPVFNGEEFLEAAIASALAQTHGRLEILIVDDGSSDQSVAIAQAHAERFTNVRFFANPENLGLVGSWNRCVELAHGDWIRFLFQDDLLAPDCVQRMLEQAQQGWPFVACDREFIFDGPVPAATRQYFADNRRQVRAALGGAGVCSAQRYAQLAAPALHLNFVGEPTVQLLRADVFKQFGKFNPAFAQLMDLEFWHRVGCNVGLGFVDAPLASFRVHASSATAKNQGNRQFAADSLDKLAFAHSLARSADYAPLRLVAAPGSKSAEAAFRDRANQVFEWVRLNGESLCGSSTVAQVYQRFVQQLPACAVTPAQHRWWLARSRTWQLRQSFS